MTQEVLAAVAHALGARSGPDRESERRAAAVRELVIALGAKSAPAGLFRCSLCGAPVFPTGERLNHYTKPDTCKGAIAATVHLDGLGGAK